MSDTAPIDYTVSILTQNQCDGIQAALDVYNADLPPQYEGDGVTLVTPTPGTINSCQDYVNFVMNRAADSYYNHYLA